MQVIERFKVVDDDGVIYEINKWDSDFSLESSPIYRTANGKGVTLQADGSFAVRNGKMTRRLP